jgi:hypothetical protein
MSYILDALRRLEQDKEKTKRGANPMEAVLVPDMEQAEEPERRHFWWMGIGLVLLLTAVAATYWITRHTLGPPAEKVLEGAVPHLSSARPEGDRLSPTPSPETETSSSRPRSSARRRPVPRPSRVTVSAPGETPSSSPFSRPAEGTDVPVPARTLEGDRPALSAKPVAPPVRQERTAMSRETSAEEDFQEWRGSDIKINAIAYSRKEKNRFAVVNLKTVHEGDRVEDLAVVEIQEDGIIFESEGTKYRIRLGGH